MPEHGGRLDVIVDSVDDVHAVVDAIDDGDAIRIDNVVDVRAVVDVVVVESKK